MKTEIESKARSPAITIMISLKKRRSYIKIIEILKAEANIVKTFENCSTDSRMFIDWVKESKVTPSRAE